MTTLQTDECAAPASSRYRYRACGLDIRSDIELPGLRPRVSATDVAPVSITQGPVPEEIDALILKAGPNWQRSADAFLLKIPGLARFLIGGRSSITYQPDDGIAADDLTAFLTGSVLGILLHLRQSVVLHASAVLVGGQAVLFCGASGAGKSTLCAALGKRGHPMLSDDLCVLAPGRDGRLWTESDGRQHKLWERSLRSLDLEEQRGAGVRHQINKFYVRPRSIHADAAPVTRLYQLVEQRNGEAPGIEPLALADAAIMVRQNAFRPRMMWQLEQKTDYFRVAAQLYAHARFARFRRPFDFSGIEQGLDMLERDWADRESDA